MQKTYIAIAALLVGLILNGCTAKVVTPPTTPVAAVKLTPEQAKVAAKQGRDLVFAGKHDEANKVLEQVAASGEAKDAKTLVMLGITRYQKKDLPGALDAYDKAIAADPKLAEPYQGKANIYRDQKNLKEAEVWYRKAWQANPNFIDAYQELALQLNLANRIPDAISALKEGVVNNPQVIDLQIMLGGYYGEAGQKDLAKQSFEAALKIDPANKAAKDGLARLK